MAAPRPQPKIEDAQPPKLAPPLPKTPPRAEQLSVIIMSPNPFPSTKRVISTKRKRQDGGERQE
jgi:hypothetical protein